MIARCRRSACCSDIRTVRALSNVGLHPGSSTVGYTDHTLINSIFTVTARKEHEKLTDIVCGIEKLKNKTT